MTRVTILHSFYSSATPSGENVAVELQAAALRDAGHETTIVGVSTDDLRRERFYGARTAIGVATGTGIDPTRRLSETEPDVVHVHNLFPNFATRWLQRWPGPIVATLHNYRPLCAAGTLARDGAPCTDCVGTAFPLPALRHRCYRGSALATAPLALSHIGGVGRDVLLRRADQLVFLAPRARQLYADAGFVRLDRARIIPNFVQPIPSTESGDDRDSAPWLYVGRLAPEKGVVPMLSAWPHDVPLHVVGAGPQEREVARLCTGSVVYRGSLQRTEVLEALLRYRGLVFPSLFAEGLPTVYLESLAAGLPVVARAGNSAADDVQEHGTGVVFETFDGLHAALREVDADRRHYATRAAHRYEQAYSPSAWVDGITSVYDAARAARSDARVTR